MRFFLDYGAGWEDQGVMGFNVHDIPNSNDCHKDPTKPLSYVASLKIDPKRKVCRIPVLPKVRAILSWQAIPPAGNPAIRRSGATWSTTTSRSGRGTRPSPPRSTASPWRSARSSTFRSSTRSWPSRPIPIPDPPELSIAELATLYAAAPHAKAPAHAVDPTASACADIHAAVSAAGRDQEVLLAKGAAWKLAGLDLVAAIAALDDVSGQHAPTRS